MTAARRRRRQRLTLLAVSFGLIAAGVGLFALFRDSSTSSPRTSAKPAARGIPAPTPQPVACGGKLPGSAGARKRNYSKPTDQDLDPDKKYVLHLFTSCGNIDIALDVKESPTTTNSVVFLARAGFYDGLVFHRNVKNFVIQGGDPAGNGSSGSGYTVVERPPKDTSYDEGVVAMAKSGNDPPGASGSQFFIVVGEQGKVLTPEYALLGNVDEGMSVAKRIVRVAEGDPSQGQPPKQWVYIERATVTEE